MSMSDSTPANPFAVTLEALEHQVRVPLDDQVKVAPDNPERESAWAENEDRRQARLAGVA